MTIGSGARQVLQERRNHWITSVHIRRWIERFSSPTVFLCHCSVLVTQSTNGMPGWQEIEYITSWSSTWLIGPSMRPCPFSLSHLSRTCVTRWPRGVKRQIVRRAVKAGNGALQSSILRSARKYWWLSFSGARCTLSSKFRWHTPGSSCTAGRCSSSLSTLRWTRLW